MGRPKQRKRKRDDSTKTRKKGHQERFWVEDCQTKWKEGVSYDMEILITRVQLTDDYRTAGKSANVNEYRDYLKDQAAELGPSPATQPEDPSLHSKLNDNKAVVAATRDDTEKKEHPARKSNPTGAETRKAKDNRALIYVKRSKSSKGSIERVFDGVENFVPLENGDCGDGILNPHQKDEVPDKFWSQRRRLFTRFDEGIQLDKESWFSVTPEAIADHIASHLVGTQQDLVVLDPFCGCGGNAIAFAKRPSVKLVVAADIDLTKLKMAAHNAQIYQIPKEKIIFVHANACQILSCYKNGVIDGAYPHRTDEKGSAEIVASGYHLGGTHLLPRAIGAIFLSPPWGGIDYAKVGKRNYNLSYIKIDGETNGDELLERVEKATGDRPIALFLPKNTNGIDFGRSALQAGFQGPIIMEQNILNGKLKTITCYMGFQS